MSSNVTPEIEFASKWQAVTDPKEFAAKISQIPDGPIAGKWGNGAERKQRLSAAGYNYALVQEKVNALLRA